MSDQWYTNKDLFELINKLEKELQETRTVIKKYNGLYAKVGNIKTRVEKMEAEKESRSKTMKVVRDWGGWIFAFVTLIILIYTTIT